MLPLSENKCVYRKNIVYIGFGKVHGFRYPRESWNESPTNKGVLL